MGLRADDALDLLFIGEPDDSLGQPRGAVSAMSRSNTGLDGRVRVVSYPAMLRAALLDVGGTLWPDRLTAPVAADPCLERLGRLLPDSDAAHALRVLRRQLQQADGSLVQDTHGELARALRLLASNPAELDVLAVRRALCVPAVPGVRLFPGAAELLGGLRRHGLQVGYSGVRGANRDRSEPACMATGRNRRERRQLWHDSTLIDMTAPQASIIADKLAYCVDAMRVLLRLTELMADQGAKRMVARFIFVYLV